MVYVKMVNDKLIAGGRIGGIRGMSPGFATIPLPRLPPGSLRSPNFFFAHDDFFSFFPQSGAWSKANLLPTSAVIKSCWWHLIDYSNHRIALSLLWLVCLFFMLKLLQYCNYITIVMQIKLMLLLLLSLRPRTVKFVPIKVYFTSSLLDQCIAK